MKTTKRRWHCIRCGRLVGKFGVYCKDCAEKIAAENREYPTLQAEEKRA